MNRKQTLSSALSLGLVLGATLALFVLVVQAASAARSPLTPGNPTPYPEPNTHTSSATTTVSITYDEPISPTTVSTRTFAVHARQTGLLTQTYGVDEGTIILTPTQPFHAGELVQVSATTATLSLIDGTGPLSPTVWQFRIEVLGGSAFFTSTLQQLGITTTNSVALGDVDGDSDLDAFTANAPGANEVWLNDGDGAFTNSGQSLGDAASKDVALGDLDGDSDLDAFVTNAGYTSNTVWLNDGGAQGGMPGHFSDSGQRLGNASSDRVALGDLDGDGDLDAFVANSYNNKANKVWLNDGTGIFFDSGQDLGDKDSAGVGLGDLDGDGDLDAFVANEKESIGAPNTVWLNDGRGAFIDSTQNLGDSNSVGVTLGDVDFDGDLDAFVANRSPNKSNRVWLNDGTGTFNDSGQQMSDIATKDVALGDLDNDGDLDAIAANVVEPTEVWLNDGTGIFVDSGYSLGDTSSGYVALGDLDGDGDLDAYVVGSIGGYTPIEDGGTGAVWFNLNPPGPPVLLNPAHGAVLSDTTPTLTWQANPNPDEKGYLLNWNGTVIDVGDITQYTVTTSIDGVYTWTVAAYNLVLTSPYTDVWSFTVDATPPVPPALSGPADGVVLSDTTPMLTWKASPDPGAEGYLLDWNGVVIDVGNAIHYTVTVLADGTYTWTVAAYDALRNTSAYTDTWSFDVDVTPPDSPVLVNPANGTVIRDDTLTLTWQASSALDTVGYLLDWNSAVVDVGNATHYTITALTNGVYTWTVAAYDALRNTSSYADVWSFTVDARYQYQVYLPLVMRQQP